MALHSKERRSNAVRFEWGQGQWGYRAPQIRDFYPFLAFSLSRVAALLPFVEIHGSIMADSHKIVFEGSSYPEVALSPLPEARPHDFPETVSRPLQEKIIGATATPTPTKPKFFTKRRIIILTIAAVIFAAIIGGVAGGAYHAALKKGSQDGIAANESVSPTHTPTARFSL